MPYVVEKSSHSLYEAIKCEINSNFKVSEPTRNDIQIKKYAEEFTSLVKAAPNIGEREQIKHLASSHNNGIIAQYDIAPTIKIRYMESKKKS